VGADLERGQAHLPNLQFSILEGYPDPILIF
jgi:hypothetical protein